MGGAKVTCLENKIGNFEVGKEFDALLIRTGQSERVAVGEDDLDDKDWVEEAFKGKGPLSPDCFPGNSTDPSINPSMIVEPEVKFRLCAF